jgi:hypothetical protein
MIDSGNKSIEKSKNRETNSGNKSSEKEWRTGKIGLLDIAIDPRKINR